MFRSNLNSNGLDASTNHVMHVRTNGYVYGIGYNGYGQLGIASEDVTNRTGITQIPDTVVTEAQDVAVGYNHSVVLLKNGYLKCAGNNESYQLLFGNNTNYKVFTQVGHTNSTNIHYNNVGVSCGGNNTFVIKADTTVYVVGKNNYGQCGVGHTNTVTSPTKINIDNVAAVCASDNHTVFLKYDGTVYACGYNGYGQLGTGRTNQTLYPVNITNLYDIVQIACGENHSVFLRRDGTVWSCGRGSYRGASGTVYTPGQLSITNVVDIKCGGNTTYCLRSDGTVYASGQNNYGQLSLGDLSDRSSLTKIDISGVCSISAGYYSCYLFK